MTACSDTGQRCRNPSPLAVEGVPVGLADAFALSLSLSLSLSLWQLVISHATNGIKFTELDRQRLDQIRYQPANQRTTSEKVTAA